ncbi:MAG: hypothetical protein ABI615_01005 [Chthoniobacterales bacterium]
MPGIKGCYKVVLMHPALIHIIPRFRVSVLALIGGIIADNLLSRLFAFIYSLFIFSNFAIPQTSPEAFLKYIDSSTFLLLGYLVVGLLGTFSGAYLTASLAKEAKIANATLVGIAALPVGLFYWSENPAWLNIVSIILILPAAALGGLCAVGIGKFHAAPAPTES